MLPKCVECGKEVKKGYKLMICDTCFDKLIEYEKKVFWSELKFKPFDHIYKNIFIGSENSAIDW